MYVEFSKVDKKLGLALGFAIVCLEKGEPYYDLQDEHIPEDVMLDSTTDFMQHSRVVKSMHGGDDIGTVVFAFPLTTEIAKAMGISTLRTGLMVAIRPDKATLEKFASGEFSGFSIGGRKQ